MRQRERAVAAQRFALRPRVEDDDIEIGVGQRERERRPDGSRADYCKVVHMVWAASAARRPL